MGGPTGLYASNFGTSVGLAANSAKASSIAMKEIEKATAAFGEQMAPRTIELNGEVLTLTGRSDEQMATFKQIARTQLLKTLER